MKKEHTVFVILVLLYASHNHIITKRINTLVLLEE